MCGVAGVFHYANPEHPVDASLLRKMTRRIAHRGPDGEGFFIDGNLGLGHRRLSIVELSEAGGQPMRSSGERSALSYNGELYNHASFRPQLEAHGHRFRGNSDTETLLYLLEQYGPDVLSKTAGIFGFAWWDARSKRLVLARDHVGVKQLYFHDDGTRVIFASEIKALLADPTIPRALDPDALNEYLHFHSPLFERTFFKGIQQVRPGEYVEFRQRGHTAHTYWGPSGFEPRSDAPVDQVTKLQSLLQDVVRDQLMADVPVGTFFSGGIDSTAVASFAARAGTRVRCFGVHFDGPDVIDERPYQETAAKALGLDLELTTVDGKSFPDDFLRLMYFQDQPVIGSAMVPMFYVSKLAASRVKVCLGGQAADEIFGGYARYALAHPSQVLLSWFAGRQAMRAGSARSSREPSRVGGNLVKQLSSPSNVRRLARAAAHGFDWRERYFQHFARTTESEWRTVFADSALVSRDSAREQLLRGLAESPAEDPADKLLHWESRTYLTGLFQQDDRMSMANSLESRVPLADPRVVEFAFRTPFSLKLRGGASKWILRQAVADVIPDSVLNRRKVGFDTPAERWLRTDHNGFLRDLLLSSRARARGVLDPRGVERLLDSPQIDGWFDRVWKLACIEGWSRIFLDTSSDTDDIPAREVSGAA